MKQLTNTQGICFSRSYENRSIHFFCFCPLSLAIKLNFNISKVASRKVLATSFSGSTPLSWWPPSWKRSRPWERGWGFRYGRHLEISCSPVICAMENVVKGLVSFQPSLICLELPELTSCILSRKSFSKLNGFLEVTKKCWKNAEFEVSVRCCAFLDDLYIKLTLFYSPLNWVYCHLHVSERFVELLEHTIFVCIRYLCIYSLKLALVTCVSKRLCIETAGHPISE